MVTIVSGNWDKITQNCWIKANIKEEVYKLLFCDLRVTMRGGTRS